MEDFPFKRRASPSYGPLERRIQLALQEPLSWLILLPVARFVSFFYGLMMVGFSLIFPIIPLWFGLSILSVAIVAHSLMRIAQRLKREEATRKSYNELYDFARAYATLANERRAELRELRARNDLNERGRIRAEALLQVQNPMGDPDHREAIEELIEDWLQMEANSGNDVAFTAALRAAGMLKE